MLTSGCVGSFFLKSGLICQNRIFCTILWKACDDFMNTVCRYLHGDCNRDHIPDPRGISQEK